MIVSPSHSFDDRPYPSTPSGAHGEIEEGNEETETEN
jgi:hypothetical protein